MATNKHICIQENDSNSPKVRQIPLQTNVQIKISKVNGQTQKNQKFRISRLMRLFIIAQAKSRTTAYEYCYPSANILMQPMKHTQVYNAMQSHTYIVHKLK